MPVDVAGDPLVQQADFLSAVYKLALCITCLFYEKVFGDGNNLISKQLLLADGVFFFFCCLLLDGHKKKENKFWSLFSRTQVYSDFCSQFYYQSSSFVFVLGHCTVGP